VQLLIDEQLSPCIVDWCATRRSLPVAAIAAAHHGLGGKSDAAVWTYAWEHNYVVVTANARDFLVLLDVELHPGLIVLREGSLSREEQWQRLAEALDHIQARPNPDDYMINRVVEVERLGRLVTREMPPT
jgi:predicted nuclease of predicted toxin-antitoxin system